MQREIPNEFFVIGAIIFSIYLFRFLTKRMSTINDLPAVKDYIFYGIATSVGDGDGFQIFHVPWFRSSDYNRNSEKLPIRLAGIDAPEIGCFDKPAQPKSREAKEYLTKLIHTRMVRVQVLSVDIYGRINAIVHVRNWYFSWHINVNLKMLEAGLACVYDRTGAVYGGYRHEFILAEQKAKSNRLGMWQSSYVILPMDFKNWCKQEAVIERNGITKRRSTRAVRSEEPNCTTL